jgi:hypothetical protein
MFIDLSPVERKYLLEVIIHRGFVRQFGDNSSSAIGEEDTR